MSSFYSFLVCGLAFHCRNYFVGSGSFILWWVFTPFAWTMVWVISWSLFAGQLFGGNLGPGFSGHFSFGHGLFLLGHPVVLPGSMDGYFLNAYTGPFGGIPFLGPIFSPLGNYPYSNWLGIKRNGGTRRYRGFYPNRVL